MEGRTIARPDVESDLGKARDGSSPSMEGRTIARPDLTTSHTDGKLLFLLQWRAGQLPGQTRVSCHRTIRHERPFNGGPDNCPARLARHLLATLYRTYLQWRAGQLPGQTMAEKRCANAACGLQWRTGQLPGQTIDPGLVADSAYPPSMEGRTIARPDLSTASPVSSVRALLQWRAGQLPGQTSGAE